MSRKVAFVMGLVAGAIIAQNWRQIAKTAVKFGLAAGNKLNELSGRFGETLDDITAEAGEEIEDERQGPGVER